MIRVNFEYTTKGRTKRKVMSVLANIFLWFLACLCLFPFLLLLINATRSNGQLQSGFSLIPQGEFFNNFKNAWSDPSIMMGRGLINSFVIAALNAALTTYFSVMTAYAVHIYNFKGRKVVYAGILAIMMIPSQVSAVGFVQLVNAIGLTNNYLPLILPAVASPLTFFYMIQHMKNSLDREVVEAARVDGANEFYTFNKIAVPIMKPAMAVQGIFAFVASWNNFFTPALLISDKEKKTLPIMMSTLRSAANSSDYDLGKIYMFVIISIVPVVIMYLILSKPIIASVSQTPAQRREKRMRRRKRLMGKM